MKEKCRSGYLTVFGSVAAKNGHRSMQRRAFIHSSEDSRFLRLDSESHNMGSNIASSSSLFRSLTLEETWDRRSSSGVLQKVIREAIRCSGWKIPTEDLGTADGNPFSALSGPQSRTATFH
jgi:hypothetical protein